MSDPIDLLRDEHRVILRALDALERAADRLARGAALPDGWWESAVAWLRAFADAGHHAKEERSLFPALVKAGVPSDGGPIGVMLAEHEEGRGYVRAMAEGPDARRASAAREYASLLRQHIDKENDVLFAIAEAVLDEQAQAALRREFEGVAVELGREASIAAGEAAVERLARALDGR